MKPHQRLRKVQQNSTNKPISKAPIATPNRSSISIGPKITQTLLLMWYIHIKLHFKRQQIALRIVSSVSSDGDIQTLFLAVVEDADRVADGGGLVEEVSFIISVVPLVQ